MPEIDAPRAVVFRRLVKENEALGTRMVGTGGPGTFSSPEPTIILTCGRDRRRSEGSWL